MVSALDSVLSDSGSSSSQGQFVLCSWARHFTLTAELNLGLLKQDSYSGREEDRNLGTMI